MKKKIVSKVISFVLAASMLLPTNSVALAEGSEGQGNGSSSVIEISCKEELQKISENLDGNYALSENIELQSGEFQPIGTDEAPFTGTFDGKGHVISNMHITVSDSEGGAFAGLFGSMENARVQNVAIENATIASQTTGSISVGIVAGKMKNSFVEDSYVSGIITLESAGAYTIGGIAGAVFQDGTANAPGSENTMLHCVSNVSIDVADGAEGQRGALAAHVDNTALIGNSYSLAQDLPLFGEEASEGNSCQSLGEEMRANQESYAGFDFENIWKITNHGARLIAQADENTKEEKTEGEEVKEDDSGKNDIEESKVAEEVSKEKQKKETKNTVSNAGEGQVVQDKEDVSAQEDTHAISDGGTEENPTEISSESDLLELVEMAKSSQITGYYSLANDIKLTTDNWTGIGISSNCCFAGVFEGNGYSITGLKVSGTDNYAGLFAYNKGTIKNLTAEGNITDGKSYAGILCAYNEGIIENCHASGTINSNVTRGGLVGHNADKGVVSQSSSQVAVKGEGNAVGGLVGYSTGAVRYSHASGSVSGSGNMGGLVGDARYGKMSDSYASGNVTGSSGNLGGLVGYLHYGNVRGCYARGSVNGGKGCGLVGASYSGSVRHSYYNATNTGNKKGFAETTARLKRQETYYGWDFTHVWEMGEDGYPYINLRGEADEIAISGNGEEDDPYIIEDEMQLFALSSGRLPATQKRHYRLGKDIELTSGNWSMIWEFDGVFDGAGHTISGLKSTGTDYEYVGLFGKNKGTIKNLKVSGSITDVGSNAGMLCAYNEGSIENCHVSGTINCNNTMGGLVGYNAERGVVSQSSSQVTIKGEGNAAGGLVGYSVGAIRYSHASGSVSGSNGIGGLVGVAESGEVSDSYASGTVSGSSNIGGLVGYLYHGDVEGCYARGSVNGGDGCGLVGSSYSGSIRYSYYNSINTGNKIGFGETSTNLKRQATYYGWDFAHVWKMGADGYPCISLRGGSEDVEIDGNGEEDAPYIIKDEIQLFALSSGGLPATQKKYYKLGGDIALTSGNWSMVWEFDGVFDGAGHTISGLKSAGTNYEHVGLFGKNKGTIKNLRVSGSITDSGSKAGMLCGYNEGTIENCHASGTINCNNTMGGLVGYNAERGVVSQSSSQVTIKGEGNAAGGLVGYSVGAIRYSHASGSVSGSNGIGGLVGVAESGEVSDSYASGTVSGSSNIGGLVGYLYHGDVEGCYARGSVNGGDGCGLVGSSYSGSIRYSYYNSINTGNKIGFGETSTNLKRQATYYGWDFVHVWEMGKDGYPCISLRGKTGEIEITGNGEEDNPYILENETQLFALSSGRLPATQKKYYKLGNDIQLTSNNWSTIWEFNGTFDGAGHRISGLELEGTSYAYAGLFGKNSGTIKNLSVDGIISNSSNDYAAVICAYNAGTIENCFASGTVSASCCRGGVVGYNEGVVRMSKSSITISGSGSAAGALVGRNTKKVETSYAEGKVNGTNSIGGLVGENSGTVENAYAAVSVSGSSNIGGLIGYHSGTVKNSYSIGNVSAEYGSSGGLIGYHSGTVISSYYNKNKSGCEDTDKGMPLTNLQMKDEASFEDWDFAEVWGIYHFINGGFPFLQVMFGEYEEEDSDFWYSVKESKKGYAFVNQKMGIFYNASPDSQVAYKVEYIGSDGKSNTSTVIAKYEESKQAFAGEFEIEEGMQQISSIKAQVTDGIIKEIPFTSSFWYQMPLKVEGTMNVVFNEDIINSPSMTLKVFKNGKCIFKSALDGEPTLTVHSLETGTDYKAVVYGKEIEYASLDQLSVSQGRATIVDFSDTPKMASLGVEFYADGVEFSNKELKTVFYDKTVGKSRLLGSGKKLDFLSEGDTIGYSVSMGNQLSKTYKADSKVYTITLNEGENIAKVELEKFQTVDLSGVIYEQDGMTAIPGVKVTAVQQLNDIHSTTISGNTDSFGKIELSGKDTETTITLSKTGYLTSTFTVDANQLGKIERKMERAQGRIQFGVSYLQAAKEDAEDVEEKYNLIPDKITIYNDTKNEMVTNVQNQWPNLYVETQQVSVGDTLNITISKGGYAAAVLKTTVLENGYAKVTGALLQYGGMELTLEREDGIASAKSHLMVYGEDGKKFSYKRGITKSCSFTGLPAGSYTIVSADESVAIASYYQLKDLKENKDLAGLYTAKAIQVQDGIIVSERIPVPAVEEKEIYLDTEKSGISINNASAMVGDTIVVRAEATFRGNAKKEGAKTELALPTGTRYVENSLTINGKDSAITPKNNTLSVPIEDKNTVIRYRVKVLSTITASAIEFHGMACYSVDGENYINSIGKAELNINQLTLIVPPKTRTNTFIARGVAEKNAAIRIYDGDVLVGSVTANKYGAYRVEVTLPEDEINKIHYLKAVNQETNAESEQAQVVCGNTDIGVVGFKVIHNGKTYDVGDPSVEVGNLNLTMVPSAPFEFIAYFTDNESVALVQTEIELTNGNIQFVDMEYNDAMGYWHGKVTLDSSKVPSGFCVSYIETNFVYEDSSSSEEEWENVSVETIGIKTSDDINPNIAVVEKVTYDDPGNTELYILDNLQENVKFTPDEGYIQTEYNDCKVYVNPAPVLLECDILYFMANEMYFELPDGTYTLWQRGIGLEDVEKSGRRMQSSTASHGISDWFKGIVVKVYDWYQTHKETIDETIEVSKEIKEYNKKIDKVKDLYGKIEEQREAVEGVHDTHTPKELAERAKLTEEYLKEIAKNGTGTTKELAKLYQSDMAVYKMLDGFTGSFDIIKTYVTQSNAYEDFSDIEIKAYEKIVGKVKGKLSDEEQKCVDSMKTAAISYYSKGYNELVEKILKDEKLKNAVKKLEEERANYRWEHRKDGNSSEEEGLKTKQTISKAKTSVDPSGYVYETFEDNRIQGVTATLYYENDMGDMQIWDAEEYNQENPLVTDNDGNYAWDVPEGLWQVVYTKEGFETVSSKKMIVPPPQLDVNIAMVSTEPAQISKVSNMGDKLKITFDKYLLVDTILKDGIQIEHKDNIVDAKVCINKNDIREYNGEQVVKVLALQLEKGLFANGQTYHIILNSGIKTYAGVSLPQNTMPYVAESEAAPVSITIPDGVKVYMDEKEISSGDLLYQNDRIKVVANAADGYRLASLKINNAAIDNGTYYTVGKNAIVIDVSYERIPEESYVIFASAGRGGIITPSGDTEVLSGMDQTFQIQANPGYEIGDVKVDGKSVGTVLDYTFSKVTANHTIEAFFQKSDSIKIENIVLSQSEGVLEIGKTMLLQADITPQNAKNKQLKWSSSNLEVASVENGLVTAIGEGSAVITAESQDGSGVSAACNIKVESSRKKEYTITASNGTGGKITPEGTITVTEGEDKTFTITADSGYIIQDVKVDGKSVGAVSGYTITDIKGNHTIAASFQKPDSIKIEEITLSQPEATLEIGKTLLLEAAITPDNAENKQLKWGSDNRQVALVENGLVAAIGEGCAVITAESQDGSGVSASCKVTVRKADSGQKDKEDQSFTGIPSYAKTYGDAPFKLDTVLAKGNGSLTYASSNPKVAEVSSKGEVKITGAGKASITVTASETEEYKKCEYQVSVNVAKASQRISGTANYSKAVGSKPFRLDAKRTVGEGKISYLSTNRNVAAVSGSGMVTAKKPGNTIITVTAAETANYKACTFRIKLSVTAPKKGTVLTDPKTKAKYKVTKQGKSVEYSTPKDKKSVKATIPATVTISGVKYNVTGIAANAFRGCKKLKSVSIGKNVESIGTKSFANCTSLGKVSIPSKVSKIGKQAFSGCGKLKDITIKSAKLTSKTVGAKAFQGINAKATIKVPKAKKAAYQKLLKSKGIGKKVKIK